MVRLGGRNGKSVCPSVDMVSQKLKFSKIDISKLSQINTKSSFIGYKKNQIFKIRVKILQNKKLVHF